MKKRSQFVCLLAVLMLWGCADVSDNSSGENPAVSPVNNQVEPGLYISGETWGYEPDHTEPGYWKDGVWIGLPCIDTKYESSTHEIKVHDGSLYVVGSCCGDDSTSTPVYWKDGVRIALSLPANSIYGEALSIAFSDNSTYIAGSYKDNGGNEIPGYWKDGIWNGLTVGTPDCYGRVSDMVISGEDLYIGGDYEDPSIGEAIFPGYWKNDSWVDLTPGYEGGEGYVTSLMVKGDDLYIAGYCTTSRFGGDEKAGYWLNGNWNSLSSGESRAVGIALDGDDLYVGGLSYQTGEEIPGYWKNGVWMDLPALNKAYYSQVYSLDKNESGLYLVGYTCAEVEVPTPCYWLNDTRYDLDLPGNAVEGWTRDFCIVE